jgi:hypothetical protein
MFSKNKKSIFANLIQKVTSFLLGLILVTGTAFVMLNTVKVEAAGELNLADCGAYSGSSLAGVLLSPTKFISPVTWVRGSIAANGEVGPCKTSSGLAFNCYAVDTNLISAVVANATNTGSILVQCKQSYSGPDKCITLSGQWLGGLAGGSKDITLDSSEECKTALSEFCGFQMQNNATSEAGKKCKEVFGAIPPRVAKINDNGTITFDKNNCIQPSTELYDTITSATKKDAIKYCASGNSVYECSTINKDFSASGCVAVNAAAVTANKPASTKSGSDANCGGLTEPVCLVLDIVIKIITFLLWGLVQLFKFVLGVMGGMFVILVSINPASNSLLDIAYAPWQTVLNIANIVLLAGIIFMGFGYILNLDIIKKAKGLQDFFLGLLVVGVMMQFTFAASAAVVNFTNGLGNIIYFGAGGIASDSVTKNITNDNLKKCLDSAKASNGDGGVAFVNTFICNVSQISKATSQAESGSVYGAITQVLQDKSASGFVTMALVLVIYGLAIFSFVRILFILLIRIFGVWMLIVVSPLALVAYFSPLPMIKDFATKWIDNFFKLSFAYPFFTFGITLVTLIIGNVSSAIKQSATQAGFSAINDGTINTFAQAQQLGSGTGTLAANIIPTAGLAEPDVIASIIIGLFCFGLVFAFGELFWKVFSGFWDAAVKAGKAIASTVSTGARIGAGAIRGAGDLAAGAYGLATKKADANDNLKKGINTEKLALLENRKQKLKDEKKAAFENMLATNKDGTKTKAEREAAKNNFKAIKEANDKKITNIDGQIEKRKSNISMYSKRLEGRQKVKDTIKKASNAPEWYLAGGGIPGLIGEKLNPKNWAKDQEARLEGNRVRKKLETEKKFREEGLGDFLEGTSYNQLAGYYNGKELMIKEDELKNKMDQIVDTEVAKKLRVQAAKLGQTAAAKRVESLHNMYQGNLERMTTADREAYMEAIKAAASEPNGLSSILSEDFVKSMQNGTWEKLDTDTRNKLKKDYGGMFMKGSERAAWVNGADPKDLKNLNPDALLYKGGQSSTLWNELLNDRYGGDFDKASEALGDSTVRALNLNGPLKVKSNFTSRATDAVKNMSSYKNQSQKIKDATESVLQKSYSQLDFRPNSDAVVNLANNLDNEERKKSLINGLMNSMEKDVLGAELVGVANSTQAQSIISKMNISQVRATAVGEEAYSGAVAQGLAGDEALLVAQNALLHTSVAAIESRESTKQALESQAAQINEAVVNSRPEINMSKQEEESWKQIGDLVAGAGLMKPTEEALIRDLQKGDLTALAESYGGRDVKTGLIAQAKTLGAADVMARIQREALSGTVTVPGGGTHTFANTDIVDPDELKRDLTAIAAAKTPAERAAVVAQSKQKTQARIAKLNGKVDSRSMEAKEVLRTYDTLVTEVGERYTSAEMQSALLVEGSKKIRSQASQTNIESVAQMSTKGVEIAKEKIKTTKAKVVDKAKKVTGTSIGTQAANKALNQPATAAV